MLKTFFKIFGGYFALLLIIFAFRLDMFSKLSNITGESILQLQISYWTNGIISGLFLSSIASYVIHFLLKKLEKVKSI